MKILIVRHGEPDYENEKRAGGKPSICLKGWQS